MEHSSIIQDVLGVYHWTGIVDAEYEKKVFKMLFEIIGTVCLIMIGMCLAIGPKMIGVMLLTCLLIMAIVGGVCWVFNRNAGNREQRYSMTKDDVIFHVNGQPDNYFPFKRIRKAVVYNSRNMIELYLLIGYGPVFVKHEDFGFIRDYILQRIPESAKVLYR